MKALDSDDLVDDVVIGPCFPDHEFCERFAAAMESLRPKDRQLIILRIEFNHSHQEIAEMMGMRSADAACMAVHRALVRLARELKDEIC
jgi:DNA-directed RNA polymerase specialized sigma24 family protein